MSPCPTPHEPDDGDGRHRSRSSTAAIEALADQERRRTLALFDVMPALMAALRGRELVVEMVTPRASQLFGGRLVRGRSLLESTPELRGQGFFDHLLRVYDTGEPFRVERLPARIARSGEGRFETGYYDVVCQPTRGLSGAVDGLLVLGVDVTREVLTRRELERAVAARDEFLSAASHELGTPLAIIELALQTIERRPEDGAELGPRTLERLARARRAARRLARVRDSLVAVSRERGDAAAFEPSAVDVAALVRDVASDLADVAQRHRSSVEVEVDDEPLPASLDVERIGHALSCVLDNALKFGAGHPVQVHVRRCGGCAEIRIVDHGIGIAPEDQARIFEPFERVSSPRHYSGLGLGLWTARQTVRASGGDVEVESVAGAGSMFRVRLQLASSSQAAGTRAK